MATGVCKDYVEGGSEETFEYICTSCKESKIVEAVKYCQECDEHYCLVCVDLHKRFPALRNHVILDREDVDNWEKQATILAETCDQHPGELVKLFCGEHKQLCCHICVSLNHRICEGMQYIAEVSTGINESEDLKAVKKHLEELKTDLERQNIPEQHESLEISRCQIIEQIAEFRKHVNEIFDALQKKVTDKMDKLANDISSSNQEYKTACDDILIQIQQLQRQLEFSRSSNEPQVFITMKKCQFQIPKVKKAMKELPRKHAEEKMIFEIDPKLESFVVNIDCLGTVTLNGSSDRSTSSALTYTDGSIITGASTKNTGITPQQTLQALPSTHGVLYKNSTQKTHVTPIRVSRYEKFNIKMQSDKKKCNIGGICQMPDESFLLADFNNSKIKRLDPSTYRVTDQLDLPARPFQICSINNNMVIITTDDQLLIVVNVEKSGMNMFQSFRISHACHGIACVDGRLIISDEGDKVYIHELDGQHFRTIKLDNRAESIFSVTRKLVSNQNGTRVFVADEKKGLVVLDKEGEWVSTNGDEKLIGAESVYVDTDDRVLVCNLDTHKIVQIDIEGTQVITEVVRLKPYECPKALCIDHRRRKMLVLIFDTNYIRAYDIEHL